MNTFPNALLALDAVALADAAAYEKGTPWADDLRPIVTQVTYQIIDERAGDRSRDFAATNAEVKAGQHAERVGLRIAEARATAERKAKASARSLSAKAALVGSYAGGFTVAYDDTRDEFVVRYNKHAAIIDAMKATITTKARRWDKARSAWIVAGKSHAVLKKVVGQLPELLDQNAETTYDKKQREAAEAKAAQQAEAEAKKAANADEKPAFWPLVEAARKEGRELVGRFYWQNTSDHAAVAATSRAFHENAPHHVKESHFKPGVTLVHGGRDVQVWSDGMVTVRTALALPSGETAPRDPAISEEAERLLLDAVRTASLFPADPAKRRAYVHRLLRADIVRGDTLHSARDGSSTNGSATTVCPVVVTFEDGQAETFYRKDVEWWAWGGEDADGGHDITLFRSLKDALAS